jgi:hypothetical protein
LSLNVTDLSPYTKKLVLPDGFDPPRRLVHEDVVAHALTRDDLAADVRGINASLGLIREMRGGSWPTGPVTEEENYVDLVWHECEFRDHKSFTYVLEVDALDYIGNAYFYPMGVRRPLTPELARHDVDVSWWVTPEAYERGYYAKVFDALRQWSTTDYPFAAPHYSNARLPS